MANAGCINAYDCSGNLIRTLEQLQSSNIGVGVQYTAPNPLDDKKIDYIKYTDKCGNTCCLTGENEILIYATNGVIKNLTLTNDDVNEAIKIKWNDIFGSNRAKTVVRYKTGSYPVSITDGTLAVEETTKNQYSSTPFSLSGVLDETTYYITAFAVDSNNTVISSQTASVTTDFGWHPSTNTLLYLPMQTDLADHGPLNISITNENSVNIASGIGGATIPVGNFGTSSVSRRLSFNNSVYMTGTWTISVFAYFNDINGNTSNQWFFVQGTNSENHGLNFGVSHSDSRGLLVAFYGNDYADSGIIPSKQTRYHFVATYNGNGTVKIYRNGVLQKTGSGTKFAGNLYTTKVGARPRDTSYFNGYMSKLIVENYEWSQQDITKFLAKYKSLYGIS